MWSIGAVSYLNAVPLLAGLSSRCRLTTALPAALSPMLAEGTVDAALLPVAEALRGVGGGFVGRHGIASEGKVRSVLVFLKTPAAQIRTVLLDPASRTSAALTRWVLASLGAKPESFRAAGAPGPDPERAAEDAVLVIGDPALGAAARWKGAVLDLGEEWTRLTGLPFVFARWTVRKGLSESERREIAALVDAAADEGLPRRGVLAREFASERGDDPARAEEYVRKSVRYRIGPREEEALGRFAAILGEQDATAAEVRNARPGVDS